MEMRLADTSPTFGLLNPKTTTRTLFCAQVWARPMLISGRGTHPRPWGQFGLVRSLSWGPVLCTAGCLAASLASTH